MVDSLTQAFTTSKATSPAIEGKIAKLIDNMLIGELSAETVKERVKKHPPPENCKFLAVAMMNEEIWDLLPNCGFGFPTGSGTLVTRNIGSDQIGGQIGERHQ